jgi:predicted Zn-dependent protease
MPFCPRALAAVLATVLAVQPATLGLAQPLPDLGSVADTALSPQMERRIGESIARDFRLRDPTYLDDPEIEDFLARLGSRLAQATPGSRGDFVFFLVRDGSINAFALPGGFVGVHLGLLTAAETESELASVLAHEIAHVTQRHVARMLGQQQQMQLPMMVALAAALLLGASRPDLASGAAAAAQAGAVSSQLSYSRDFEREADRIGLQALEGAGFDPRAMAVFFERLQRANRVMDESSAPSYLRSHPVTVERIADAQNKAAGLPYRQHLDTPEFQLVRAKLRSQAGDARDTVASFERSVREGRYASEIAARYGLACALLRAKRPRDAEAEFARLRAAGAAGPMFESLGASIRAALGDTSGAADALAASRVRYPHSRPLLYAHLNALEDAGRAADVLRLLVEPLRAAPRDRRLYEKQARAYAMLGKRSLQHQSQAEVQFLQGNLPAAIEQLQLARTAGDGDFYQLSVVDARLKELRNQQAQELRDSRR